METVRYEIPEYRLAAFRAVIAKAAKKAEKLGVEPFSITEVGLVGRTLIRFSDNEVVSFSIVEHEPEVAPHQGTTYSAINVMVVEVTGPEPVLDGWRFVAAIDHDPEGNIVNKVPGDTNPVQVSDWVAAPPDCEHCKLSRSRRETYLLVHEDDTLIQVGSTCIQDFLGGATAAAMAKLAETWMVVSLAASDEGDWGDSGGGSIDAWRRDEVVIQAVAVVREVGFLGKGKAEQWGKTSTADRVMNALTWRPRAGDTERPFPTVFDDGVKAAKIIEWVEELELSPTDDYLWNLQIAVARPATSWKTMGLVVSAVSAYDREVEKVEREAAEALNLRPVPLSDKRVKVTGKVLTRKTVETDFGTTWKMLLSVPVEDGACKLWGSIPSAIDPAIGDTVSFMARVDRSQDDETFGWFSRPTRATVEVHAIPDDDGADSGQDGEAC